MSTIQTQHKVSRSNVSTHRLVHEIILWQAAGRSSSNLGLLDELREKWLAGTPPDQLILNPANAETFGVISGMVACSVHFSQHVPLGRVAVIFQDEVVALWNLEARP